MLPSSYVLSGPKNSTHPAHSYNIWVEYAAAAAAVWAVGPNGAKGVSRGRRAVLRTVPYVQYVPVAIISM